MTLKSIGDGLILLALMSTVYVVIEVWSLIQ